MSSIVIETLFPGSPTAIPSATSGNGLGNDTWEFQKKVQFDTNVTIQSGSTLTLTGVTVSGLSSGVDSVVATNAHAFLVGQTSANPALNIDTSTASSGTGINIKSAAAAAGVAVSVITSGTNEALTIDGAGSGTVGINTISTTAGLITLGNPVSLAGIAVNGALKVTSTSANTLVAGPGGTTNPTFNIDSSVTSAATGLNIQGQAAGSKVLITAISSGTNEDIAIDAKGTGNLRLNNNTSSSGANIFMGRSGNTGTVAITGFGTGVFSVGRQGQINPAFNIDTSASSSATGLNVIAANAGSGLALTTVSSGTNENLTLAGKGSGTVTVNPLVAAVAGGQAQSGIQFGSISVGLFTGTGTPTFSAMNGSIYVDSNATTTTTRIYVNKSGAGTAGTTWTNLTTAA